MAALMSDGCIFQACHMATRNIIAYYQVVLSNIRFPATQNTPAHVNVYNPEQAAMINTVADNCNNSVAVTNALGPCLLDQLVAHDRVISVLYGYVLG
ncbi:hypothetical protein BDV10DRAFT_184757 [Aspergillus recurvatus]